MSLLNVIPLSADPTKWSNSLKQFVGKLSTNCLSVIEHFTGLVLKGLKSFIIMICSISQSFSFVFTRADFCSACVHLLYLCLLYLCLLVFYACSLVLYSCFIHTRIVFTLVLLVITRDHLCSTCVYSFSPVFIRVQPVCYFSIDLLRGCLYFLNSYTIIFINNKNIQQQRKCIFSDNILF